MHYLYKGDKMNKLDKIKSSMTVSLGLKNRLRKLKGSSSYEKFISQLIRERNALVHGSNYIELNEFNRKERVFRYFDFMIVYSYNEFNKSSSHIFDVTIKKVRKNGKSINLKSFFNQYKIKKDLLSRKYQLYFQIIEEIIREDIEPLFKHNGRFEDYFSWEKEFKLLGLKSFEEDVMIPLRNMSKEVDIFD